MRNYTTQMDAARKGILTPEIKTVAEKEHMETDKLIKLVAEGKVAICANKNHKALNPEGEEIIVEGEDFLARALQHEIDHLDGVLFIDTATNIEYQK